MVGHDLTIGAVSGGTAAARKTKALAEAQAWASERYGLSGPLRLLRRSLICPGPDHRTQGRACSRSLTSARPRVNTITGRGL
jgi:hypothetical protein